MEFKRTQNLKTREMLNHYVDGKEMSYEEYEMIERTQKNNGKSYNSSYTTIENDIVIHTHHYN